MSSPEKAAAIANAELVLGETRAVINPLGAYLEQLRYGDQDLLEPFYMNGEGKSRGGLFVAWPFFGPGEAFEKFGFTTQHGLTRREVWNREDAASNPAYARFSYDIVDDEKFGSFTGLHGKISYALGETDRGDPALTCTVLTVNNSDRDIPAAPGPHPYFPHGPNRIFTVLATDDMGITGTHHHIASHLVHAKAFAGNISSVEFKSSNALVTMNNDGLPKYVVWSDDPGRIVCVEPTHAGMLRTPDQLTDLILAPGDVQTVSTAIMWQLAA